MNVIFNTVNCFFLIKKEIYCAKNLKEFKRVQNISHFNYFTINFAGILRVDTSAIHI